MLWNSPRWIRWALESNCGSAHQKSTKSAHPQRFYLVAQCDPLWLHGFRDSFKNSSLPGSKSWRSWRVAIRANSSETWKIQDPGIKRPRAPSLWTIWSFHQSKMICLNCIWNTGPSATPYNLPGSLLLLREGSWDLHPPFSKIWAGNCLACTNLGATLSGIPSSPLCCLEMWRRKKWLGWQTPCLWAFRHFSFITCILNLPKRPWKRTSGLSNPFFFLFLFLFLLLFDKSHWDLAILKLELFSRSWLKEMLKPKPGKPTIIEDEDQQFDDWMESESTSNESKTKKKKKEGKGEEKKKIYISSISSWFSISVLCLK